uniref:syntaxin-12 isoform X1 n=1 Tax=Ciona intestinalis TaxID=7719 RepID=UPI000180C36B|nr:syntaxin-12 isoform X1 [Ciona intestinalis]XP_026691183.1 syntaxin-12 isoform X2 [Ciona intestinalis]|eukprot:XP_026691180.1 syntaxin-12 isoform X1 [Ciona intestinalis]
MQSSDDARNYTRLTHLVGSNLQKITKNVQEIKNLVCQLNDHGNSGDTLTKINQRQHHTKELLEATASHLSDVKNISPPTSASEKRQRNTMTTRLTNDLKDVSMSFQDVQRDIAKIERESVARMRSLSESNQETQPFIGAQGGMQMQEMATHDISVLEERERELQKLESDIVDVNIIFKDLAKIVEDQGEMIDSIEANVEAAHERVDKGKSELGQAVKNQKKSRKKKIICGIILLVLIIILILIIYFSIPK